MTATYTIDVFSCLDGFGSDTDKLGGYWAGQGPELLFRIAFRMLSMRTTYLNRNDG